ncbi:MAG: hypothetical protein ACYSWU_13020 [Planctomycetota bacterium]|jgi:hypothetical protein
MCQRRTLLENWQFSVFGLLVLVAFVSVACAALVYASLWWASICPTGAVIAQLVAVLGVVYRRGSARAFWLGFAVLGWGYLLLAFAPGLDRHVGYRLITTKLFGLLQPKLQRTPIHSNASELALFPGEDPLVTMTETSTYYAPAPQWDHFQQAGHSLTAIVIGFLGGLIASYFYNTREPQAGHDERAGAS